MIPVLKMFGKRYDLVERYNKKSCLLGSSSYLALFCEVFMKIRDGLNALVEILDIKFFIRTV
jgi:hypothetical protein